MSDVKLICGDCLDALAGIDDGCVQLIVTSPPYNKEGLNASKDRSPTIKGRRWTSHHIDYGAFDDNLSEPEYQAWQVAVLAELYRVCGDGASLFYNHKPRTKMYRVVHPLEWIFKTEWRLAQEITWDRGSTPAIGPTRFYPTTEKVYWLFKGDKPRVFNREYANHKEVWRIGAEQDNPHPAPFPLEIPLRCVGACSTTGDTVLDPFMGSGTTGIACAQLGRNFIGIEKTPRWHELAQRRIEQARAQLALPLFGAAE